MWRKSFKIFWTLSFHKNSFLCIIIIILIPFSYDFSGFAAFPSTNGLNLKLDETISFNQIIWFITVFFKLFDLATPLQVEQFLCHKKTKKKYNLIKKLR